MTPNVVAPLVVAPVTTSSTTGLLLREDAISRAGSPKTCQAFSTRLRKKVIGPNSFQERVQYLLHHGLLSLKEAKRALFVPPATVMSDYSLPRTPWIELTQLTADDEGWWHLTLAVADDRYLVQQEFYVYPRYLLEWAEKLARFPSRANDDVQFTIGDRESAHWVSMRAWLVDRAAHAAMAIDLGTPGDELYRRSASFAIPCDVASLNRVGEAVRRWVDDPTTPLREPLDVS